MSARENEPVGDPGPGAGEGLKEGVLVLGEALGEPVLLRLNAGSVCLFTTPAPEAGRRNEDGAGVVATPGGSLVLAVADGVGGERDGAAASRRALLDLQRTLGTLAPEASVRSAILDAVETTNRELTGRGAGATTLAVAEITDGRARPYHVGDSEVWAVGGGGRVRWQTTSHSPTGYGLESGLLGEVEAFQHEDRHVLSNAVGSADMRIEVGSFRALRPRDTLLLATDGLFDNLLTHEIIEIVRKGPLIEAACRLRDAASDRMASATEGSVGKADDLSFVLYRPAR